jgi:hypothetical protein
LLLARWGKPHRTAAPELERSELKLGHRLRNYHGTLISVGAGDGARVSNELAHLLSTRDTKIVRKANESQQIGMLNFTANPSAQ